MAASMDFVSGRRCLCLCREGALTGADSDSASRGRLVSPLIPISCGLQPPDSDSACCDPRLSGRGDSDFVRAVARCDYVSVTMRTQVPNATAELAYEGALPAMTHNGDRTVTYA